MPSRQFTPNVATFILIFAGLSGCRSASAPPQGSEANISQMMLGRWYREDLALDGEIQNKHQAIEFADDGSCTCIESGTSFYPNGLPAPWRETQPGQWQIVGKILKRTWRATESSPARTQEGEILSVTAEELKLREFPFDNFDDYYRTIRVRRVKTNRPNQALQPTANQRTTQFSDD